MTPSCSWGAFAWRTLPLTSRTDALEGGLYEPRGFAHRAQAPELQGEAPRAARGRFGLLEIKQQLQSCLETFKPFLYRELLARATRMRTAQGIRCCHVVITGSDAPAQIWPPASTRPRAAAATPLFLGSAAALGVAAALGSRHALVHAGALREVAVTQHNSACPWLAGPGLASPCRPHAHLHPRLLRPWRRCKQTLSLDFCRGRFARAARGTASGRLFHLQKPRNTPH